MNVNIPTTETRNTRTRDIDRIGVTDILHRINDEDARVAAAVRAAIPQIARAVEAAEAAVRNGGRCIYVGCGTSGRLGVLDASECPPTFGVSADMFMGVIAGGETALRNAVEGAEDDRAQGAVDLQKIKVTADDFIVGVSASGGAPYVHGALFYARGLGCATAMISCAPAPADTPADMLICAQTGAEALTGSTRMKSGTAQKMILNMISTGTMIRLGKTYENLMVDMRPTNIKLVDRACRIIVEITNCEYETAKKNLQAAGNELKAAILMSYKNIAADEAREKLVQHGGRLHEALQ